MREQIKKLIKKKGITQEMLGAEIGSSRIAMNRYFNRKTDISSEKFIKIITKIGGQIVFTEEKHEENGNQNE